MTLDPLSFLLNMYRAFLLGGTPFEGKMWPIKLKESTDCGRSSESSGIALMTEAARTSETSADIDLRTRQYIPEDSELHTRRRENLKSHRLTVFENRVVRRIFGYTRDEVTRDWRKLHNEEVHN
jgi:hypothetical protein